MGASVWKLFAPTLRVRIQRYRLPRRSMGASIWKLLVPTLRVRIQRSRLPHRSMPASVSRNTLKTTKPNPSSHTKNSLIARN